MAFAGVSYLAVLAAAVASFLFGGVWYGALSKTWLGALGKSDGELKSATLPLPALLLLTIAAQLVMAWVLAGIIGHLGPGRVTLSNGLMAGALCWLGFVATSLSINHGYQGARGLLTLIDGGHWLGVLLIQGAVIGAMGVR